jgi:sec-independent protein translocase protein TatB
MNLLGIGTGELVLILVIALLVLGPERLPEIARLWAKFSRTVNQFTRTWHAFNAQLNAEVNRDLIPPAKPARSSKSSSTVAAPSPTADSSTSTQTIAPPHLANAAAEPLAASEESPAPSQADDLDSRVTAAPADVSRHEPK